MALTFEGFKAWSRSHRVRFVMNGASADHLFEEMYPVFLKLRATTEELEEASLNLWTERAQEEIFWDRHCAIMKARILRRRAEQAQVQARDDRRALQEQVAKDRANGTCVTLAEVRDKLAKKFSLPEEEKPCPKCGKATPLSQLKRTWCVECCAEFDRTHKTKKPE